MSDSRDLPVAILAGGFATRLGPIAARTPKLLVEVAGEPFFAHQLRLLRAAGLSRVVVCVGHLGEQIVERFGDGAAHGMRIAYSFDGPKPLGTGGALIQALPLLGPEFLVLYGDSYLPVNYAEVVDAFRRSGRPALMTVYANENRHDRSNVWFEDGRLRLYDKRNPSPAMRHIDYGLGAFSASAFTDQAEPGAPLDLADLQHTLSVEGRLAGHEVHQRFYEIGTPAGLAELDAHLSNSAARP